MRIYNHLPNWCDFEPIPFDFETKEDLLSYDWLKRIESEEGGIICFDYNGLQSYLMAVYPDKYTKEGCRWWVLSLIHDNEIAQKFNEWFPDYHKTLEKFKP